jgi:hypothetical protein
MSTELETQPYRNFKELLNKIIKMPQDLQQNLTDAFEKRRLEMQNAPKEEELEEEAEVKEETPEPTSEKSWFDNVFSGTQGSSLLDKVAETPQQSPQLAMANAPQHKCVIRGW